MLDPLRVILGALGALLGLSWALLGSSWAVMGPSGPSWGHLGLHVSHHGAILPHRLAYLVHLGLTTALTEVNPSLPNGTHLGTVLASFGPPGCPDSVKRVWVQLAFEGFRRRAFLF